MTAGASPESLVNELTLAEQVSLLAGVDFWHTASIERLGIPALRVSDGPVGARGRASTARRRSTCRAARRSLRPGIPTSSS